MPTFVLSQEGEMMGLSGDWNVFFVLFCFLRNIGVSDSGPKSLGVAGIGPPG